ncbi:MAG: small multi-drug export protein [Paenibacillus sp.]|nr:small multi-drug export protein [Paenibacillus sp.]
MTEDVLTEGLKWLTVAGTSVLELWAAIPLGFALGLHPLLTGLLSALGSIISAYLVIQVGGPLRRWMLRRWERKNKQSGKMSTIWNKYGVVGLGFISPLITGAPLGAVIGISFGAAPGRLLLWMTVGILFWSFVLTAAVALGIASFLSA